MLFREQNLKNAEASLFTRMVELVLMQLVELTTSDTMIQKRKASMHEEINLWLRIYEAELYQDRYLPSYQRAERERLRHEQLAEMERKMREQQALKKVERFGAD